MGLVIARLVTAALADVSVTVNVLAGDPNDPNYPNYVNDPNNFVLDVNNPTMVMMDRDHQIGAVFSCGMGADVVTTLTLLYLGILSTSRARRRRNHA